MCGTILIKLREGKKGGLVHKNGVVAAAFSLCNLNVISNQQPDWELFEVLIIRFKNILVAKTI